MRVPGLRARIALIWVVVNLCVSALIGYLILATAGNLYRESFLAGKLAVAKTIAASIDGDVHAGFVASDAARNPEYRRYLAYLHLVKQGDPYITYLYTLVPNPTSGRLLYGVDADILDADTLWIEAEHFAFSLHFRGGRPVVKYDEQEHEKTFPVEVRPGTTLPLEFGQGGGTFSLRLGEVELLRVLTEDPLKVSAAAGVVDRDHRELVFSPSLSGSPTTIYLTLSASGESGSAPGSPYVDTTAGTERIQAIIREGRDLVETEVKRDNYGVSLSAYAVIRDGSGRPAGLVEMDFYQRELEVFQARLLSFVAAVTAVTFAAILAASLLLAQYLLVPLRRVAEAVGRVAGGDLDVRLRMRRRDEFGRLADGFNGMVEALGQNRVQRDAAEAELSHMAYFDQLTGLPNRKSFQDRLDEILGAARRSEREKLRGVLFLDLDRFKDVNDTLGHQMGDRVLQEAGGRIRAAVRQADLVFRQGGDEFTVILTSLAAETHAALVAEKLVQAFTEPFVLEQHRLHVGLSVGIALYPRDGQTSEELTRSADTALFEAKKERSNYHFFAQTMQQKATEKLALVSSLHQGIAADQFVLHFQPVMDLDERLVGCEALLRWNHPEMGSVSPGKFIPVAEETGLIVPLGRLGLLSACRLLKRLAESGMGEAKVAVNLSVKQLRDERLVRDVRALIDEHRVDPRRLELEITESGLMDEPASLGKIEELRSVGVRFSIDDFGTGYSSLSRLSSLPVDTLKVDRSFIAGIPADHRSCDLVRAVVTIAHGFEQTVCAEGVETREQLDFLGSVGCDMVQGYLFSPAVPEEAFLAFVRAHASGRPAG